MTAWLSALRLLPLPSPASLPHSPPELVPRAATTELPHPGLVSSDSSQESALGNCENGYE